ncbi:hypothetical protein Q3G72_015346 [Acer saccharum]|nr:hypothetical protein Q3G72_015346 [Acer saccharum]
MDISELQSFVQMRCILTKYQFMLHEMSIYFLEGLFCLRNRLSECSNGHTICSGCKPRVHTRCPTCRHELGNIRCLAMEKVAASLEHPCKYQSYGMGDISYLVTHLKDDHKVDMHSGSTFNHRYVKANPHEVKNATWMLTFFSCFG